VYAPILRLRDSVHRLIEKRGAESTEGQSPRALIAIVSGLLLHTVPRGRQWVSLTERASAPSLSSLGIEHKTGHNAMPRAMNPEMALKAISQKEVVWYRAGLEGRSQRTRTRSYF